MALNYADEQTEDSISATVTARTGVFWLRLRRRWDFWLGVGFLAGVIALALAAPHITPGVTPKTSFLLQLGYGVHGPSGEQFPVRIFGNAAGDYSSLLVTQQSVLAEVTYGARGSLAICLVAGLLAAALGAVIGGLGGYFGGWLDQLGRSGAEILLAIPLLPLLIGITLLSPVPIDTVPKITLLFTVLGWPPVARLARGSFLVQRQEGYIEAARAQGVSGTRIVFRHMLPNTFGLLITGTTVNMATFLVAEATLGFLTLSVTDEATWGNALAPTFLDVLTGSWWEILFPTIFIVLTVLALNAVGDALRAALDMRGRY